MGNLLLQVVLHPFVWRTLGRAVLGAGSAIGLLAWRVGKMQERIERRVSHFNIDIEVSIANALPDWLFVFLPQSALGWCVWAAWMVCGCCMLSFAKKLKQYY